MSSFGLDRGPGGNNGGTNSGGQVGPQRDAWNNPIKEVKVVAGDDKGKTVGDTGGDDGGINADVIDTIWDQVKKENSEGGNNQNNNNNNGGGNNNNPAPPDPAKQMQDYLKSVGLEPMVLSEADKTEMAAGNFDNVIGRMNDRIQTAHLKALSGAQTMLRAEMKEGIKQAVAEATGRVAGDNNLKALNIALPFTKDKAIGPVAQTVMQRFLDRGMSTDDAIKGVRKFFDHTRDQMGTEEVNRNLNGNYRGGNNSDNNGDGDWLSILGPKG